MYMDCRQSKHLEVINQKHGRLSLCEQLCEPFEGPQKGTTAYLMNNEWFQFDLLRVFYGSAREKDNFHNNNEAESARK